MKEFIKKLNERLEKELRLADEEKRRCASENPLQFDSAKGYANGIAIAIDIVNQVAEEEQCLFLKLPVEEGSTVYVVDYTFNCKHRYECPLCFSDKYKCEEDIRCEHEYKEYRVRDARFNHHMIDKIGEIVFLTKEEAERKLEKLTT